MNDEIGRLKYGIAARDREIARYRKWTEELGEENKLLTNILSAFVMIAAGAENIENWTFEVDRERLLSFLNSHRGSIDFDGEKYRISVIEFENNAVNKEGTKRGEDSAREQDEKQG